MSKPDKDITKPIIDPYYENRYKTSKKIIKWDATIYKKNYMHGQVGHTLLVHYWKINIVNLINRLKEKNHMIISIDAKNAFDKNLTPIHDFLKISAT